MAGSVDGRRRLREREREKSRSETRERPHTKSRERANMRSVSIKKESSRGTTYRARKQAEADPQRQYAGRCRKCHNFNGETPRNIHNYGSPCYAKGETCAYCRVYGHVAEACWYKIAESKDDKELVSHPCFPCENSDHVWRDCPRDKPDDNDKKNGREDCEHTES